MENGAFPFLEHRASCHRLKEARRKEREGCPPRGSVDTRDALGIARFCEPDGDLGHHDSLVAGR